MQNGEELDDTFMVETEVLGVEGEPAPELGAEELDPAALDDWTPPWLGKERKPIAASPVESLLLKLDMWLLQQPEFIFLITSAPRPTRREASRLIAKHCMSYPMRGKAFGGMRP
jgi:hypothetical protein